MRHNYLFTSESVAEGHPDKVCDRISDEVVDTFFRLGPKYGWAPKDLRVACETLATTNRVVIAHEDQLTCGFGAELAARISDELFDSLDAPIKRVAALDCPVAYAPVLEERILPGSSDVLKALRAVAKY